MDILLLEDERQIADIYSEIFDNLGYTHQVANTAAAAFAHLSKTNFKLLLVDLMLPDMNGIEFIEEIRTLENYEKFSIVVMSNMGSGFDKQSLINLGVKEILLKLEVGPEELSALAAKYCQKQ